SNMADPLIQIERAFWVGVKRSLRITETRVYSLVLWRLSGLASRRKAATHPGRSETHGLLQVGKLQKVFPLDPSKV
ncbi:MAG TPA: hypothetical protein VGF37_00020, partial [Chthoniobacterales bacterium]